MIIPSAQTAEANFLPQNSGLTHPVNPTKSGSLHRLVKEWCCNATPGTRKLAKSPASTSSSQWQAAPFFLSPLGWIPTEISNSGYSGGTKCHWWQSFVQEIWIFAQVNKTNRSKCCCHVWPTLSVSCWPICTAPVLAFGTCSFAIQRPHSCKAGMTWNMRIYHHEPDFWLGLMFELSYSVYYSYVLYACVTYKKHIVDLIGYVKMSNANKKQVSSWTKPSVGFCWHFRLAVSDRSTAPLQNAGLDGL